MTQGEQVAVITGTTHGIGRVTARGLARAGLRLVMLCRNVGLGETLADALRREVPGAQVGTIGCDLGSLDSVRRAAAAVLRVAPQVDLLVNNAGIVSTRHRMSVDGFELTFATNALGPFLLTELLRGAMRAPGRIVNVASCAHLRGTLDLATVADPHARYRPVAAYNRSKLANVMHTLALARRLDGSGITANCLHPGIVATHLLPRWLQLLKPLFSRQMLSEERGAATSLHLALSPDVAASSGRYYDEHQQPAAPLPAATDIGLQESLWRQSARWVGLA